MHAFDVLGDPVRRRILELLATREHASGEVVDVIAAEFGITQAAVSQHLKVLRESGFAVVRPEGTRRVYTLDTTPLRDVDDWLDRFRVFWTTSSTPSPPKSPAARSSGPGMRTEPGA